MFSPVVILVKPGIEIEPQCADRVVDLLAEGDAIELVEHGFVQPFDDAVGLRQPGPRTDVVDIFHGQMELVFVMLGVAFLTHCASLQAPTCTACI